MVKKQPLEDLSDLKSTIQVENIDGRFIYKIEINKINESEVVERFVEAINESNLKVKAVKIMDKYYTPAIEDIRVGYECEIKPSGMSEIDWMPIGITADNAFGGYFRYSNIRTPYLTKEQIEAEGWKTGYKYSNRPYTKSGVRLDGVEQMFELEYKFDTNILEISYDGGEFYNFDVFMGKCPSINEFRTICKLLNI